MADENENEGAHEEIPENLADEYVQWIHKLEGQFVILKPEYWDQTIEGFSVSPNGNPEPADLRMPDMDWTRKEKGDTTIRLTPRIGYVTEIRIMYTPENEPYIAAEVQTDFYFPRRRHGDYEFIDPSWLTTFKVVLRPDAEKHPYNDQPLGNPSDFKIGEIVDDTHDPDNSYFIVRELKSYEEGRYNSHDLLFLPDDMYEDLKTALPLTLVAKSGFLPTTLPKNIEHVVFSQLSGYHSSYTPRNVVKEIQDWLYGSTQTQGVEEVKMEANALNNGPLPYGPSEENFVGGKRRARRKSVRKLGTQMARRGTRRSRGIFSRLYSPIGHLLSAGKESVGAVTNTAKGVVGEGIGGLDKIGRSVTKHANMAVKDVFTRKGGKRRGSRKSRKTRRNTRRRR